MALDSKTLVAMSNRAVTYWKQGNRRNGQELLSNALETNNRVIGIEDPGTLAGMHNLAVFYAQQGRWKKAEEL